MNKVIFFLFVILPFTATSQNSLNLVPNWSFEYRHNVYGILQIPAEMNQLCEMMLYCNN
jgi:hypothetical protein